MNAAVERGNVSISQVDTKSFDCATQSEILPDSPLRDLVPYSDFSATPNAEIELLPLLTRSSVEAIADMFRKADVVPGQVARRNRFGDLIPVPVNVISSELVAINVSDVRIRAVFIQHHLAENPDLTYEAAKRRHAQELQEIALSSIPDRNIIFRIPRAPARLIYEREYSRPNGSMDPWRKGHPERIAAYELIWNGGVDENEKPVMEERYLSDSNLDNSIAIYKRVKADPVAMRSLAKKEAYYRKLVSRVNSEHMSYIQPVKISQQPAEANESQLDTQTEVAAAAD